MSWTGAWEGDFTGGWDGGVGGAPFIEQIPDDADVSIDFYVADIETQPLGPQAFPQPIPPPGDTVEDPNNLVFEDFYTADIEEDPA